MLCLFSNCAPFSTCVVGEGTKNSTLWSPAKGLLQTNTPQLAWPTNGEDDFMTNTWVQLVPPQARSLPGSASQASATPSTGLPSISCGAFKKEQCKPIFKK